MRLLPSVLFASLVSATVLAEEAPPEPFLANRQETFGAVATPAPLPAAAAAVYGYLGVPEVGAGYRQGFSAFEVGGRARFNYLVVAPGADAALRMRVLESGKLSLAGSMAAGLTWNSGSRYFYGRNFQALMLRLEPAALATFRSHDTLRALGTLRLPWDLALSKGGGYLLTPPLGGGVEFFLGEDLSVLALGELGPDVRRSPGGVSEWRVGYSVKVGLGYRMF